MLHYTCEKKLGRLGSRLALHFYLSTCISFLELTEYDTFIFTSWSFISNSLNSQTTTDLELMCLVWGHTTDRYDTRGSITRKLMLII